VANSKNNSRGNMLQLLPKEKEPINNLNVNSKRKKNQLVVETV